MPARHLMRSNTGCRESLQPDLTKRLMSFLRDRDDLTALDVDRNGGIGCYPTGEDLDGSNRVERGGARLRFNSFEAYGRDPEREPGDFEFGISSGGHGREMESESRSGTDRSNERI